MACPLGRGDEEIAPAAHVAAAEFIESGEIGPLGGSQHEADRRNVVDRFPAATQNQREVSRGSAELRRARALVADATAATTHVFVERETPIGDLGGV